MPPHQGFKRVLIPVGQESLQQLVIRLGGKVRIDDQAVDEFDYSMHLSVSHWTDSPITLSPLRYCEKLRRTSRFLLIFTEKFRNARRRAADPGYVLLNRFNTAQRKRARAVFPVAAKAPTPIVALTATPLSLARVGYLRGRHLFCSLGAG